MKKTLLILSGLVVLLEGIYLLAANVFLNAGMLNPLFGTDEIQVHYRYAYSIFPGRVTINKLRFLLEDSDFQMRIEMSRAVVTVDLPAFFSKKFRATRVAGKDLNFGFRTKRTRDELTKLDLSVLPPIPEMPNLEKKESVFSDEPSDPWKVEIEGIELDRVSQLWFDEYRFQGKAFIGGSFKLFPKKLVEVKNSKIKLDEGVLTIGGWRALHTVSGSVDCTMTEFNPSKVPGLEILKSVDADLALDATIESASFLNYYFRNVKWLKVTGGGGRGHFRLGVRKGELVENSRLDIKSEKLDVHFLKQVATGKGLVSWALSKDGRNRLGVSLENYSLNRVDHPNYKIEGKDLSLAIQSRSRKIAEDYSDLETVLEIPRAQVKDLRYFNAYLPKASKLKFTGGEGFLEAHIVSSLEKKGEDHGRLLVGAKGAKFLYEAFQFNGDLELVGKLSQSDIYGGEVKVSGSTLSFRDVDWYLTKDLKSMEKQWWADIVLGKTEVSLDGETRVNSEFTMSGASGRPIIAFLSEATNGSVPSWVENILAFRDLKLSAAIEIGEENLAIRSFTATGASTRLNGWLRKDASSRKGRVLLQYGPFAAGLEFNPAGTRLRLQDAETWYWKQKNAE